MRTFVRPCHCFLRVVLIYTYVCSFSKGKIQRQCTAAIDPSLASKSAIEYIRPPRGHMLDGYQAATNVWAIRNSERGLVRDTQGARKNLFKIHVKVKDHSLIGAWKVFKCFCGHNEFYLGCVMSCRLLWGCGTRQATLAVLEADNNLNKFINELKVGHIDYNICVHR